ncbi:hypothetical protein [Streptosporangium sp. 'caverna']|uniref:hypothetical protein n=1 Tax=Streptosporangium sp. 'caverna' TaxID=2202249 RepID=UPI000D7E3B8B|nr:hypothetical protein [Streptosporangium sp. 'caverna']AWS43317.1 hypothetical protein DKM19_19990 [Streptosporangium sp. 'caverna']
MAVSRVSRRLLLVVAGWLATALVATAAGVTVLNVLGGSLTGAGGHALTPEEVRAELAAASPRPPLPSSADSPGPAAHTKVLSTGGGTVVAVCRDGLVRLRSWSPAQGYSVDDVEPGPARQAEVEFESGRSELKVEVRCGADGLPVHLVES